MNLCRAGSGVPRRAHELVRAADESGMPMHAQDESCAAREPLCQSATRGAEGVVSGMSSWCVHVRRAAGRSRLRRLGSCLLVLREQRAGENFAPAAPAPVYKGSLSQPASF